MLVSDVRLGAGASVVGGCCCCCCPDDRSPARDQGVPPLDYHRRAGCAAPCLPILLTGELTGALLLLQMSVYL